MVRSHPRSVAGLALNGDGNLVTLNDAFHGHKYCELFLLNPWDGAVMKRMPYSPLSGVEPDSGPLSGSRTARGPQPRFMDCRGDTLVVTDIGISDWIHPVKVFPFIDVDCRTGPSLRKLAVER